MHYEINVSKNGSHVFATHERSLTDESKAKIVYAEIKKRFPESEGFLATIYLYQRSGKRLDW